MKSKRINFYLKIFFGLSALAGLFLIIYFIQQSQRKSKINISATTVDQTAVFNSSNGTITTEKTPVPEEKPLPDKYLLKVPFASQAPFGDWSEPYENACEEAGVIMAEHYLQNQPLSKDQMKSEIDAAVAWQIANWGGHTDLNADQTLTLAQNYFKLSGKVVRKYSLDEIKKYISSGVPVLAPTAGRLLGNPNFRGAGPEYHMLVLKGYDDSQGPEGAPFGGIFITNDPGTRKGENYIYKYQTVLDAISGPHSNMEKAVVVLGK